MQNFDVCVIGAGPSGYAAAMRAIDFGKSVLLIEKNKIGGAGVFNGALSSKTLWELAQRYASSQSTKYGYYVFDSDLDFKGVMSQMHQAEFEKYQQLKQQVDVLSKSGLLTYVHGNAKMIDANTIEVERIEGLKEHFSANYTILAVGSRPRYLPNIPIDEKIIVTSDGISSFDRFPESMVILGAGVIGCEFATIFSNFGKTKVYMIDKLDRILPFEDRDISDEITKNFNQKGIVVHHGSQLKSMKVVDNKVVYTITYEDGRDETYTVEKALISVGRVPNVEHIGLHEIGMKLDERGYAIDDNTQTSLPNIFAVGDFTADIALVNIAEMEGRYAVEKIFGQPESELSYKNVSTIMFVNPEVAGVGMNESQAKAQGIGYRVAKINYKFISRAIAKRNDNGFLKLIVSDDDEMKIIGMRVVGEGASAAIQGISILISMGGNVRDIANCLHAHPSMPEGIQECARMLLGNAILKPSSFKNEIDCYRVSPQGEVEMIAIR